MLPYYRNLNEEPGCLSQPLAATGEPEGYSNPNQVLANTECVCVCDVGADPRLETTRAKGYRTFIAERGEEMIEFQNQHMN